MKNIKTFFVKTKLLATSMVLVVVFGTMMAALPALTDLAPAQTAFAATPNCSTDYKLLGIIPTWYKYFGADYGVVPSDNRFVPDTCGVVGGKIEDHIVQIGLAVIDILLRIGALVAVAFIMMGGYRYMSSQGEPKNLEAAMATLVNAAIGLAIVVTATVVVSFIGYSLKGGP